MTLPEKKWYHKTIFQVILHCIAWMLFFSLPAILSFNGREGRPGFPGGGRSLFLQKRTPADSVRYSEGKWFFADSLRERQDFRRGGRMPVSISIPSVPSMLINGVQLVSNIGLVLLFYFNAYLLIPRFLYRRRYLFYFGLVLLAFLLTNFIVHLAISYEFGGDMPLRGHIVFNLFPSLLIITASTLYRYIKDKIKNDQLQQEKENEQLKTELSFLRSQISPHFLFNVMNSAVSLARTRSEQLEETLIKISQLLRYMLYESEFDKVSLLRETEYLENYIELQKLRFGDQVHIFFQKTLEDANARIEPMLLIPFVENAFKHGIGNLSSPRINILLHAGNNTLYFEVRNKFEPNEPRVHDANSGIGIPNVQRRLQLLYPEKHQLLLRKEDNWFIAELTIHLS
ncbi:MAG: sensor histidine kinase [Chitinophagaceae bacterium]